MTVRLEYRDNMYGDDGFANHMLIFVGLGFWVPFDFEYQTGVKVIKRRTTSEAEAEEAAKEPDKEEEKKEEEKKEKTEEAEPSLDDLEIELGD